MATKDWGKIKKTKAKSWITAEYSNKVIDKKDSRTILVYDDNEAGYGWRVFIGNTFGKDTGKYFSFGTKPQAIAFAKKYMSKN